MTSFFEQWQCNAHRLYFVSVARLCPSRRLKSTKQFIQWRIVDPHILYGRLTFRPKRLQKKLSQRDRPAPHHEDERVNESKAIWECWRLECENDFRHDSLHLFEPKRKCSRTLNSISGTQKHNQSIKWIDRLACEWFIAHSLSADKRRRQWCWLLTRKREINNFFSELWQEREHKNWQWIDHNKSNVK